MRARDSELAGRLRAVRVEMHGGDVDAFARRLGLGPDAWLDCERGAISAATLLRFLVATRASSRWLATGVGPRYRDEIGHRSPLPPEVTDDGRFD